ncbi:hypothetical protein F5Y04DRAFT_51517 [Hypomontagnella monticulosa]|nr:hypothetical protein F5Y04DRAFT_51517 [Hypomontagnella monticulosa]
MPPNPLERRTQFSSCDACRRSRIACDASKHGHQPGEARWSGSCSRCALKKRPCTFEWIDNVKRKPSNSRQTKASYSSTNEIDPLIAVEAHGRTALALGDEQDRDPGVPRHDATCRIPGDESNSSPELPDSYGESASELLMRWSDQIFNYGFETIFGLLVGGEGCPFVNGLTSETCIPATQLFRKLDADMNAEQDRHSPSQAPEICERRREKERRIDESLERSIRAFTARWLPLLCRGRRVEANQVDNVIRDSWRVARKDMLRAANHISYRSALTLYLFSQTPVPAEISEDEELDGISGSVCIQTALLHIQRLRDRQRSHRLGDLELSTWEGTIPSSDSGTSLPQAYLDFESRAYWAAMMWDTSSSLTMNVRTSLTSGLNGACSEPTWRLVRTFLLGSFPSITEPPRTSDFEMSNNTASKIIANAAVCQLQNWKDISSLKEALREGVEEDTVLFVWKALHDVLDIFKTSVRPLLDICGRHLHFADQASRLRWYMINLQYYLGILVLADSIEAANRPDLLSQIEDAKRDAEVESINILKFGLDNTYTIYEPRGDSNTTSGLPTAVEEPQEPITVSLVAIDPHPDHVVDLVLLVSKVISRKYRQGSINQNIYSHLSIILLKTIEQLPQSSKTVRSAHNTTQRLYSSIGIANSLSSHHPQG